MGEPLAERVIRSIEQAAELYHSLIMLVAPAGMGKTAVLQEVHKRTNAPLFNVNFELSRRMLDLTERQRVLQLPRLLSDVVDAAQAGVVLLDNPHDRGSVTTNDEKPWWRHFHINIEVLFDVSLKQDPLRMLQGLSRNKTVVAAWGGSIDGEHMVYAKPDHPEYKRYPLRDFIYVSESSVERRVSGGMDGQD